MRYASMSGGGTRRVNLPSLFGGINLRDGGKIADSQLSDALNVWRKDGLLQTRPGFNTSEEMKKTVPVDIRQKATKIKPFSEIRNGDAVLISIAVTDRLTSENYRQRVYFIWQSESAAGAYTVGGPETRLKSENDFIDYFALQKDGVLFCFYADGTLQKADISAESGTHWTNVLPAETYIPTVYAHCKAVSDSEYKGTLFEGFNLICDRYKMIYSTVNRERITTENPTVQMIYPLPKSDVAFTAVEGKKITAKIIGITGNTCVHEAVFSNGVAQEAELQSDGLRMKATIGKQIVFYNNTDAQDPTIATLGEADYVEDNMELNIPRKISETDSGKVFKMTRCCHFGGAAGGIKGGSRVFLCGNSGDERALILWSGLNNPLYFDENCYMYAGDKAFGVTAFGKQGEKLVIFKENEVFYTYYGENTEITADDLTSQNIVDYEASAVYFPLVALSGYTGCDAPDTVMLCRNRLVWANSDGHVYTLASINQYNALDIFPISEMVDSALSTYKEDIKSAVCADISGHYALIIGENVFLCDYDTYGFRYISSYSKKEDANEKIPWYIWRLPQNGIKYSIGKSIAATNFIHFAGSAEATIVTAVISEDGEKAKDSYYKAAGGGAELEATEIESLIATKFFDFGAPELNKRISAVNISFADNGGREMLFEAVSEKGVMFAENFSIITADADKRSIGHIKNRLFRNVAPIANKICLKISSYGRIAVSSAEIEYKFIGGAK